MTDLPTALEMAEGPSREAFEADFRYLVALADWAAGEGFCQIPGLEEPEEWCFRKWSELGPPNGDGYSAEALADAMLAAALRAGGK